MALPDYAMRQPSFPGCTSACSCKPLFRPFAETVLDRVNLTPGDRVLDIACGTGIVARLARERMGGGTVVGVDLSPQMLAVASAVAGARRVAERHLGPIVDQRYNFGGAADLEALLVAAGFTNVRVETETRTVRWVDAIAMASMEAVSPQLRNNELVFDLTPIWRRLEAATAEARRLGFLDPPAAPAQEALFSAS